MKKVIIILAAIAILAVSALIFGKRFLQTGVSPTAVPQSTKQAQESRAAQQAAIPKSPATAKVSSIVFDNQQQTLAKETKFSLKATIDPKGKKVSAAQLDITFDPKILKLESIAPSDDFSLVLANSKIDNKNGTASIALGIPLGKPSLDSVSTIATFNFQTLSATGQAKINFTDKTGAAADGEKGNIVSSLELATIIVQ